MTEGSPDIWLLDLVRGTSSRFTFDPKTEASPIWSPDGKRVAYVLQQESGFDIYWKDAAGAGNPEPVLKSPGNKFLTDWSSDGRWIIFGDASARTSSGTTIWALPVTGDRKPVPIVASNFRNSSGRLSRDGRFLAYFSNETGTPELYVRTFAPDAPSSGGKWQISTGGTALYAPKWRADGKELFYVSADQKLMAVPVKTQPAFQAGTPIPLFDMRGTWDVSADGQRFLAGVTPIAGPQEPQQVVLNWTALLPKRK